MLSAHGSAPEVVAAARARGGYVVDAVCPLVTKVHHEVKTRAGKGYQIVYVGHEGHEEAVGTMAVAPDAIHRVETPDDVAALPEFESPVAVLAQTTLSHREWAGVLDATRERFPELWQPGRSDLCFATTNRQSALMEIAPRVRRHGRDRVGELLEHQRARQPSPARRAARSVSTGSTGPDELPVRPLLRPSA